MNRLLLCLGVFAFAMHAEAGSVAKYSSVQKVALQKAKAKFKAVDMNHDGRVTLDEMELNKRKVAKKSDLNQDGVVTWEEYQTYVTQQVNARINKHR